MSLPGRPMANSWSRSQTHLNAWWSILERRKPGRTLKQFGADWGFWRWSDDSKSILMAKTAAEPGEQPGVYRLHIADGKWTLVALFNGLSVVRVPSRTFSR